MHIEHELFPFLHRLADAAANVTLPHFRKHEAVENKLDRGFDPVTVADKGAERAMRELIKLQYPEHGILGEEYGTEHGDAQHVWVLDPIDGTRSFITGIPLWSTLIGLKTAGEPALGMMSQPFTRERFAGDTKTACYQGPTGEMALHTSSCDSLASARLFTTSPRIITGPESKAYDRVEAQVQLARYGTDSYSYCMVAMGQADIVIETDLQPYDIMALVPIVTGAGGCMTTWTGGSPREGGSIVASAYPRLHEIVLKELANAA